MAEEGSKKEIKKKIPTALKRVKQDKKRKCRNSSFKSRVRTAVRLFKSAVLEKDKERMQKTLDVVYSLMDKGVKLKIYTKNKAARTKSRFSILIKKAA